MMRSKSYHHQVENDKLTNQDYHLLPQTMETTNSPVNKAASIEVEYQEGKIEESGITEVDNSANEFFSLAAPLPPSMKYRISHPRHIPIDRSIQSRHSLR